MTTAQQEIASDLRLEMRRLGQSARAAAAVLARSSAAMRDRALMETAGALRAHATDIQTANRADLDAAAKAGLNKAMLDRLTLNADRIEAMLSACLRDREVIRAERSLDVRFDDFMADDLGTARRILELSGHPATPEADAAMRTYLDTHQRGRLGRIDHRAADVGLDVDELRERFAAYTARFL